LQQIGKVAKENLPKFEKNWVNDERFWALIASSNSFEN